jgi:hypothetical protein
VAQHAQNENHSPKNNPRELPFLIKLLLILTAKNTPKFLNQPALLKVVY